MKALFASLLLFLFVLGSTSFSFKYNKLSRALFAYGKSVVETSIINFDLNGNRVSPYFDKLKLEEKTEQYFAASLAEASYSFSITYMDLNAISSPQSFKLFFSGEISPFYTYEKEIKYMISEGLKNNE